MQRLMLKSKIHRARLTATQLHYEGSLGIDAQLLAAADILPGEQIQVVNVNNGARLVTYAIAEPPGSGRIALKGAAARCGQVGDLLIIMAFAAVEEREASQFAARVIHLDENNRTVPQTEK